MFNFRLFVLLLSVSIMTHLAATDVLMAEVGVGSDYDFIPLHSVESPQSREKYAPPTVVPEKSYPIDLHHVEPVMDINPYEVDKDRYFGGLVLRAKRYFKEGDYAKSLATLDRVFIHEPYHPEAQELRQRVIDKSEGRGGNLFSRMFQKSSPKRISPLAQELRTKKDTLKVLYNSGAYLEASELAKQILILDANDAYARKYLKRSQKKINDKSSVLVEQSSLVPLYREQTEVFEERKPQTKEEALAIAMESLMGSDVFEGVESVNFPEATIQIEMEGVRSIDREQSEKESYLDVVDFQETSGSFRARDQKQKKIESSVVSNDIQSVYAQGKNKGSNRVNVPTVEIPQVAKKYEKEIEEASLDDKVRVVETFSSKPGLTPNFQNQDLSQRELGEATIPGNETGGFIDWLPWKSQSTQEQVNNQAKEQYIAQVLHEARQLNKAGLYDEAIAKYEEVFVVDPENKIATREIDRARIDLITEGNNKWAERKKQIKNEIIGKVEELQMQAEALNEKGKYDAARILLSKALVMDPDNEELIALKNKNDRDAYSTVVSVVGSDEARAQKVQNYVNDGVKSYLLGDYEKAKKQFEKVLEIDPNDEKAKNSLLKIERKLRLLG